MYIYFICTESTIKKVIIYDMKVNVYRNLCPSSNKKNQINQSSIPVLVSWINMSGQSTTDGPPCLRTHSSPKKYQNERKKNYEN